MAVRALGSLAVLRKERLAKGMTTEAPSVHEPDAVESVVPQSRTRCIFCELHLLIADQHLGDKQAEFLRSKYLRGPTLMNQCTR